MRRQEGGGHLQPEDPTKAEPMPSRARQHQELHDRGHRQPQRPPQGEEPRGQRPVAQLPQEGQRERRRGLLPAPPTERAVLGLLGTLNPPPQRAAPLPSTELLRATRPGSTPSHPVSPPQERHSCCWGPWHRAGGAPQQPRLHQAPPRAAAEEEAPAGLQAAPPEQCPHAACHEDGVSSAGSSGRTPSSLA